MHLHMLHNFIQTETLLVFRLSRSHPQEVMIHFMSQVNKIVSRCKYQSTE